MITFLQDKISLKVRRKLFYMLIALFVLSSVFIKNWEALSSFFPYIFIALIIFCFLIVCGIFWLTALLSYHICFKPLISFETLQNSLIPPLIIRQIAVSILMVLTSVFSFSYAEIFINIVGFLTFNCLFAYLVFHATTNKRLFKQKLALFISIQIIIYILMLFYYLF